MLEASLKITLFFNKQTYILGQLSTFSPNTLNYLAFQSFGLKLIIMTFHAICSENLLSEYCF
jgi:hypothetical protein